jgi:hypothetical protein
MKMNLTSAAAVVAAMGMTMSAYAYDGCVQLCPAGAVVGDTVTVTMSTNTDNDLILIAHENDQLPANYEYGDGYWQVCFEENDDAVQECVTTDANPEAFPGDGTAVFELTAAMVVSGADGEGSVWNNGPGDHWSPFGTADLIANGTNCENGFGCDDVDISSPEDAINWIEPPADPTNQGPTEVPVGMPVGGVAGLALLLIAGASGGAFAVRKRS